MGAHSFVTGAYLLRKLSRQKLVCRKKQVLQDPGYLKGIACTFLSIEALIFSGAQQIMFYITGAFYYRCSFVSGA